jgi:hypothetical protein
MRGDRLGKIDRLGGALGYSAWKPGSGRRNQPTHLNAALGYPWPRLLAKTEGTLVSLRRWWSTGAGKRIAMDREEQRRTPD